MGCTHAVVEVVTHNPYRDRRKPVLSLCVHIPSYNLLQAHSPWDIPNVQVEVNTLPMIQFIRGYFALK